LLEAERRAVLITRPLEEAARTAALVEARGFVPLVAPLLAVRQFFPALPQAVQAVLVTSGNALTGLKVAGAPLLTVGDATAERARAAGFANVHSASGDATALAALAVRLLRPDAGPLLLACGSGQGRALAASLRAGGFAVIRRVTYAATPVAAFPAIAAAALRTEQVHAALFLSAETAAAFVRLLPPALTAALENVLALAIGKPAADALKPLRWRQIRRANSPTLDDVLALL
jgi:uroporphyrinogen-III synthase